jgi:hypothetical protein
VGEGAAVGFGEFVGAAVGVGVGVRASDGAAENVGEAGEPEGAGVVDGPPHAATARAATARRERIRVFTLFSCLSGVSRGAAVAAV